MLRGPACSNASRRRIGPLPGKVGNRAMGHIFSPLRAVQAAGVPSPEYIHLEENKKLTCAWTEIPTTKMLRSP